MIFESVSWPVLEYLDEIYGMSLLQNLPQDNSRVILISYFSIINYDGQSRFPLSEDE